MAASSRSTMDELTGISNRRGFILLGQQSLHLFVREAIPASLVFMDLDRFKPINDTFGHAEGDRALILFAEQLKSTFRNSDIFARLGGDEFVVLLSNSSRGVAERLVARFRRSLQQVKKTEELPYDIGFSSGIVAFDPEKHSTIERLLAEGDSLMYTAKQSKR